MSGILEATPIVLREAERAELDGLARSTKTEYRLRQRSRIVLLAAEGLATRAIARAIGCTVGTASKWRVRYADLFTEIPEHRFRCDTSSSEIRAGTSTW